MTRASDFRLSDIVATPGGRSARVTGITVDEVSCVYLTDGEEVAFRPHLLRVIAPALPHPVSRDFLRGVNAVREGKA